MAITLSTRFEVTTCYKCGIQFAVPEYFDQKRIEDHNDFYCPNGHGQHYTGKSEAEKLREQLQRERQQHDQESARLRDQAEQQKRSAIVAKGQLTKIKNRVGNGVCPCCKRSFSNLARHMHQQHPTFVDS